MRLFTCGGCGQRVYFENVVCARCGLKLGFLPDRLELSALEPSSEALICRSHGTGDEYRPCVNYSEHGICNWMVSTTDDQAFCHACRLNNTIPDLSIDGNHDLWHNLEIEKRRLVYSLLRLGLPVVPRTQDPGALAFDFLADSETHLSERGKVFTGHAAGLITINIKEADPAARERMREKLAEPYRTLLGHFRHESGHYYWDLLVRNSPWLDECRRLFGDDTLDYAAAMDQHYRMGAPVDWAENYISSYATMHPWEDWAETWAHYLHMVDTLETAWQFGLGIRPRTGDDVQHAAQMDFDPYREPQLQVLIDHWLPLTLALNSLNRSMGHAHAYPFVLSPQVIQKLDFVHRVIHDQAA